MKHSSASGVRSLPWPAAIITCSLAASCGGAATKAPDPVEPPTPGTVFGGDGCKAVRNPREPKLTAWDPEDRAQINVARRSGVVAVRYALSGCDVELEVLPSCVASGSYEFTPTPFVKQDYFETRQDLFAELPLGAASISGKLEGNQVLRTDYTLVGVAALRADAIFSKQDLKGSDCDRATHVVARVYLGGFAMAAGKAQSLKAEASLFGAGVGVGDHSSYQRVLADGDAKACERARQSGKEDPLCSVALRVGLLPLNDAKCSAGSEWDGEKCANVAPPKPPELAKCEKGQQLRDGHCAATATFAGSLLDSLTGQARADYEAGSQLYRQGDKAGARTRYMAAYEASHDPRLLWNVAVTDKDLRRYDKTEASLRRYLHESGSQLSAEDEQQAFDLLAVIQNFVSTVTFEVEPPGTTIIVDDEMIGQSPLAPIRLSIGQHTIRLEKDGFRPYRAQLGLMGSETVKTTLARTGD